VIVEPFVVEPFFVVFVAFAIFVFFVCGGMSE
jgi:hypothetical protein